MKEVNGQMALRLHQITGEPLAHCSYLLDQTNGDYETALKILERILQQRKAGPKAEASAAQEAAGNEASTPRQAAETLEERVLRLENQMARLTVTLDVMSENLTRLLDKLSEPDSGPETQ